MLEKNQRNLNKKEENKYYFQMESKQCKKNARNNAKR